MKIFERIADLPDDMKGHVIAIGNFDGVHKGHAAVIRQAKSMADTKGRKLGILTFEPHPRSLFRPDDPPFRLTPQHQKLALLSELGADFAVPLTFDWDFASQSAENFVCTILTQGLAPSLCVIGRDFRFGQLRKGSADDIIAAGIDVLRVDPVGGDGEARYSSSDIRQALREGNITRANTILGRAWEIEGTIVRGDRRGHELGYPTANVPLHDVLHPAYGVYATFVRIEGEDIWRPAATNIGIRPMFELKQGQVEAHILDFEDRDIYDRTLTIRPVARLRGEAKFNSLNALIEQMAKDCAQARDILAQAGKSL